MSTMRGWGCWLRLPLLEPLPCIAIPVVGIEPPAFPAHEHIEVLPTVFPISGRRWGASNGGGRGRPPGVPLPLAPIPIAVIQSPILTLHKDRQALCATLIVADSARPSYRGVRRGAMLIRPLSRGFHTARPVTPSTSSIVVEGSFPRRRSRRPAARPACRGVPMPRRHAAGDQLARQLIHTQHFVIAQRTPISRSGDRSRLDGPGFPLHL
jgi:hypothetical protein